MDRLEAMSMLLEVVRQGSFSAAARSLRVSVPTLSRRVSELEGLLGVRLLTRTTRKVSLTNAGATYVAAARDILDRVKKAEREVAGEFVDPIGELVVTAPTMFGRLHVLPIVTRFLDRFGGIKVRLVLDDVNLRLVDEYVDVAVRIGELTDSAMTATRLGAIRTLLCGGTSLVERIGEPRTIDDLPRFPSIAVDLPVSFARWHFSEAGSKGVCALDLSPRLTVTTPEAAVAAAVQGTGLTQLLHYQVAESVQAGTLRILLPDLEPPPVPVHMLHAVKAPLPLKLRSFMDFAAPRLRAALAAL